MSKYEPPRSLGLTSEKSPGDYYANLGPNIIEDIYDYFTGCDKVPIENELHYLIPNLLQEILAIVWADRWDWFFGIRINIGCDLYTPRFVPDAFLSIGVERATCEDHLRYEYWLPEEKSVPILVMEIGSGTDRGEFTTKAKQYKEMGALYYAVYDPYRRRYPTLSVYRLIDDDYIFQPENPVWLPEIGLGIGTEEGIYQGREQEWVYWYDEAGNRYLTSEERIEQGEQRVKKLEAQLRAIGVEPD